jgi:hypothetical protein
VASARAGLLPVIPSVLRYLGVKRGSPLMTAAPNHQAHLPLGLPDLSDTSEYPQTPAQGHRGEARDNALETKCA